MGFLDDILNSISGGASGLIGSAIGAITGAVQQKSLNKFNSEQAQINRDFQSEEAQINRDFQSEESAIARAFNSNEAALQRDWSSQEAERARDWNEEMYAKYNSLSGKIAQAEQAGVNPMFAVTGNSVSPMSTTSSAPSGASATGASAGSVGTPSGSSASAQFVDIVGAVLGLSKLKSEINLINSEAERNRSEVERTGWLSKLSEREYKIITEHDFDIQEIQSRIDLNKDQANEAFQLAGKYFEEAGKIASEKNLLEKTTDDKVKLAEYDRIMAEFEASLPQTLDNISSGQKTSLKEWFGSILKVFVGIKN